MRLRKLAVAALCGALVMSTVACGKNDVNETENTDTSVSVSVEGNQEPVEPEADAEPETEAEEMVQKGGRQVIVYYPNWDLSEKEAMAGGEVASIAWDYVTIINHAFFEPYPNDGTTDSTFDWRAAGKEPRTQFACVSTSPKDDFEDETPSAVNGEPRNHFNQYKIYSEQYPDVRIMLSVGGWTASGFFSEMAYTEEGRKSFIDSCVDLMKEYPFIGGIDIDWEYVAGSPDGERYPEDDIDQGCPIWGTPAEDNANFTALLKEMRDTFNREFGEGEKLITSCASGSTGWTLPCQDWLSFEPYLDYINIMTYDLAGKWDGVTGHASSENLTKGALAYFFTKGVDGSKLNIGSPMYATWFKIAGDTFPKYAVNAPIDKEAVWTGISTTITETQAWEKESVKGYSYSIVDGRYKMGEAYDNSEEGTITGWNFGFDKKGATYLYNNDPDSPYYMWYASYENPVSLQLKLDMIEKYNLAGIIVWESTQDSEGHLMINWMGEFLNEK